MYWHALTYILIPCWKKLRSRSAMLCSLLNLFKHHDGTTLRSRHLDYHTFQIKHGTFAFFIGLRTNDLAEWTVWISQDIVCVNDTRLHVKSIMLERIHIRNTQSMTTRKVDHVSCWLVLHGPFHIVRIVLAVLTFFGHGHVNHFTLDISVQLAHDKRKPRTIHMSS